MNAKNIFFLIKVSRLVGESSISIPVRGRSKLLDFLCVKMEIKMIKTSSCGALCIFFNECFNWRVLKATRIILYKGFREAMRKAKAINFLQEVDEEKDIIPFILCLWVIQMASTERLHLFLGLRKAHVRMRLPIFHFHASRTAAV